MGGCASADEDQEYEEEEVDEDAKLDAAEKASEVADKLAPEVKEAKDVISERQQQMEEAFREVMSRPRVKPLFDPAHPDSHLVKEDVEEEEETATEEEPPPLEPAGSDDDDDDDGVPKPAAPKPIKIPKGLNPVELYDIMELVGNKEVAEDVEALIDEGVENIDIDELLAKAFEPGDSQFPYLQAHFLRVCEATGKVPPGSPPETPEPEFQYIAATVALRQALSCLLRCPDPIRMALSDDIANSYFDEENSGPGGRNAIGITLFNFAKSHEDAVSKLSLMSDSGIRKAMNRLERHLVEYIVPAFFKVYMECGDKEGELYPEEEEAYKRNYPPVEEGMESDEDAINELNVVIVKGENIKAMDVDEGTSDCFCKLELGDESFFTNVRRKTTNPLWGNEGGRFKFEVDHDEKTTMSLKVSVWDEDADGEQFIGQVLIKCSELKDKYEDDLYDLTNENGGKDDSLGQLYMKLRLGPPIDEDMQPMDDCLWAPRMCREEFPLTTRAIDRAATQISNCRRCQLARLEVDGARGQKAAEGSAKDHAATKLQRAWRQKVAWRNIVNFKKKMLAGGEFHKVSTKGKKETRHVYCSPDLRTICWKKKGSFMGGDSMAVADVKAVLLGRSSKNFSLCDKSAPPPAAVVNASFSIVTAKRSLDLECPHGEKERAEWLASFALLFRQFGHLKESALHLMTKGR